MLWNYISFVSGAFIGIVSLGIMIKFKLENEKAASQQQAEPVIVNDQNKVMA